MRNKAGEEMRGVFWSPQDELGYLRQQLEQVKAQRNTAFLTGFDAGGMWGISQGLEKTAEVFAATADKWPNFPPELVKAFAETVKFNIPTIHAVLTEGMKEARQQAGGAGNGSDSR